MSFEEALVCIGHHMRQELPSPMATLPDDEPVESQYQKFLGFFDDDAARHRIERALNTAYLNEYMRRPEALSTKEREFVKRALLGCAWALTSAKACQRDTGGICSLVASLACIVHIFAGEFNAVPITLDEMRVAQNFAFITHSLSKIERNSPSDRLPPTELALVRDVQSLDLDEEAWTTHYAVINNVWQSLSADAHVRAIISGSLYSSVRGKFLF